MKCKICGSEVEENWWRDTEVGYFIDKNLKKTNFLEMEDSEEVYYSVLYPNAASNFCRECFTRRMGHISEDGCYCGPLTDEDAVHALSRQISIAAKSIIDFGFFSICEAQCSNGRCLYMARHKTDIGFLCGMHLRLHRDGRRVSSLHMQEETDVLKMARELLSRMHA